MPLLRLKICHIKADPYSSLPPMQKLVTIVAILITSLKNVNYKEFDILLFLGPIRKPALPFPITIRIGMMKSTHGMNMKHKLLLFIIIRVNNRLNRSLTLKLPDKIDQKALIHLSTIHIHLVIPVIFTILVQKLNIIPTKN